MSDPFARFRRFLSELKRRNVYRVAVTYAVVAFIVWQVANLLFPALGFPEWTVDFVIILTLLGLPLALVVAWAFEMTPEGMRRTATPEGEGADGWAAYQWLGLALVVLLAGGVWYATTGDGGEATPETTATDTSAARTASTARDSSRPPRIAVLPFENIARDTGDAFFAEGMHEEVLNQLSKVAGLEVISRTSVMQYADTDKPVPAISEELGGVDALLEGTVRRAGDQVRITTQLIAAPRDEHLWSTTYDQQLSPDAVFDIQADIARQIAGALETELTGGERERIEDAPTDDLAAYEAFLRGRGQVWQFWGEWTPELLGRATRNLREAVDRDSAFAEAYAWLGQAHVARIWNQDPADALRWLDSATIAVERARRIDPDRAAVHFAQANLYRFQDSLEAQADALRRVLELQPSNALAMTDLSDNLDRRGQYAEAVRTAREAVRLDPRRPAVLVGLGDRLSTVGEHEAAEAWYRRTLELEPRSAAARAGLAFNELEQERRERALAIWQDYFKKTEDPPDISLFFATVTALAADRPEQARHFLQKSDPAYRTRGTDLSVTWSGSREKGSVASSAAVLVGFIEMSLGREEEGRRLAEEGVEGLQERTHRGPSLGRPVGMWLAGGLAVLGRTEPALQEVERVVEVGPGRGWLKWYPLLDPLRSEPRFQEILRRHEDRREEARAEIHQLGIALYPPGMEPDTGR